MTLKPTALSTYCQRFRLPGLLLCLHRTILYFKEKLATTAFCGILHSLDGHLWSQSGPNGTLHHPPASFSSCQHTAPQPLLVLREKRQSLPPSFLSSCPDEFQTGFSHHIGTLSNSPRCRVCPLSGYCCEQLNFSPPHPQAGDAHCSILLARQIPELWFKVWAISSSAMAGFFISVCAAGAWTPKPGKLPIRVAAGLKCHCLQLPGGKDEQNGTTSPAAHHCRVMHQPHFHSGFNMCHHNFNLPSDFHATQNSS